MGNYTINTISDGFVIGYQNGYGSWVYHGPDNVKVIVINYTTVGYNWWCLIFGKEVENGYITTALDGNLIIKNCNYLIGLRKDNMTIGSLTVSDITLAEARAILDGIQQTIPVQFVRQGGGGIARQLRYYSQTSLADCHSRKGVA